MKKSYFFLFAIFFYISLFYPIFSDDFSITSTSKHEGALRSNEESDQEGSDNYMTVYFSQKTIYDSGFQNEKRAEISSIKVGESQINPTGSLTIEKGHKIEIYFSSHVQSLEYFFARLIDPNVINIVSIDLSHFYSFDVTSTQFMLYECLNLESIDLSNFTPNSLTNMESMFEGCEGLISIDISKIPSSEVTNTNSMFY